MHTTIKGVPDRLLDRNEVAKLVGVHPDTVTRWVERGRGPRPVRFSRRTVRFRAGDVERWIKSRATVPGAPIKP